VDVGALLSDDRPDDGLVVCLVREVHEDGVGTDVGVLGRVDSREVLVFDKN
jgi:hypothetical protein